MVAQLPCLIIILPTMAMGRGGGGSMSAMAQLPRLTWKGLVGVEERYGVLYHHFVRDNQLNYS